MVGTRWLWLAAATGCLHAAFSLYWAVGGTWLLATVGQWAVRARAESPLVVGGGLAAIGVIKLVAALAPVLTERRGPSWLRRAVRAIAWIGAGGLVLYGGANMLIAWLVLGGAIRPDGGYDRDAMIGHAALWDPLFLVWGVCLAIGLWLTRRRSTARPHEGDPDESD